MAKSMLAKVGLESTVDPTQATTKPMTRLVNLRSHSKTLRALNTMDSVFNKSSHGHFAEELEYI